MAVLYAKAPYVLILHGSAAHMQLLLRDIATWKTEYVGLEVAQLLMKDGVKTHIDLCLKAVTPCGVVTISKECFQFAQQYVHQGVHAIKLGSNPRGPLYHRSARSLLEKYFPQ